MTPELRDLKATIDDALDHHLPAHSPIAQDLVEAMRYATLSGGKRLRPMLVCAACTGVGGSLADALAPACAVEFIHAYSLIHDDLPAMDDDDMRHGLPSNHKRFGEANAILAGDALQALAFRTLADAANVPGDARLRAVVLLGDAVGWGGMVGGQSFDLAAEHQALALAHLEALHAAKTGALIRAAVQIGAVVGDPRLPDETFVLLGEFASRVGHAFQIVDDVLDVTATSETLGKPAGSDAAANKSTYPQLMGIEAATARAERLLDEALRFLRRAGLGDSLLAELAQMSVRRAH
ncbi:MAG: polyprenyl synthetase family protein [Pseudomonadales bacterium]